MRIEAQAARHAAIERAMQDEIQRADRRQFIADHSRRPKISEHRAHALDRHLVAETREVALVVRDDRDVDRITFVAGPRVRDLSQFHQAVSTCTWLLTAVRGTNAEAIAR